MKDKRPVQLFMTGCLRFLDDSLTEMLSGTWLTRHKAKRTSTLWFAAASVLLPTTGSFFPTGSVDALC